MMRWNGKWKIIFDTILLQISHLRRKIFSRWHSVLESGHWGRLCWSIPSLLPLHLHLILLPMTLPPCSFLGRLLPSFFHSVSLLSSSYLSSISILPTHFCSNPAYIFFHLPPCLSNSSIVLLPDAHEAANWLQEHELDLWKGECNAPLFPTHCPCSQISRISLIPLK